MRELAAGAHSDKLSRNIFHVLCSPVSALTGCRFAHVPALQSMPQWPQLPDLAAMSAPTLSMALPTSPCCQESLQQAALHLNFKCPPFKFAAAIAIHDTYYHNQKKQLLYNSNMCSTMATWEITYTSRHSTDHVTLLPSLASAAAFVKRMPLGPQLSPAGLTVLVQLHLLTRRSSSLTSVRWCARRRCVVPRGCGCWLFDLPRASTLAFQGRGRGAFFSFRKRLGRSSLREDEVTIDLSVPAPGPHCVHSSMVSVHCIEGNTAETVQPAAGPELCSPGAGEAARMSFGMEKGETWLSDWRMGGMSKSCSAPPRGCGQSKRAQFGC